MEKQVTQHHMKPSRHVHAGNNEQRTITNMAPKVNRPTEPSAEELEAHRETVDALRADIAARRQASAPARRAALAAGPALSDLDAAEACHCSCHPHPADLTHHEGGTTCPCQRTVEERRETLKEFTALWAERISSTDEDDTEEQDRIDEAAVRLQVTVNQIGGMAPFVITGTVDGRGFYLRERHDHWRVEIAPDENPESNPWNAKPYTPSITVASGSADDFNVDGRFDEIRALELAVNAVRTFLTRRSCSHPGMRRYCPDCGVNRDEIPAWQIYTTKPNSSS